MKTKDRRSDIEERKDIVTRPVEEEKARVFTTEEAEKEKLKDGDVVVDDVRS